MQDKSEIHISGVVLRGGNRDEEFLKALTLSERDAGLFEKKVRLGNRSHPAAVDTDGITAKLDSGETFFPFSDIFGIYQGMRVWKRKC